jgi:hypothetical protein
MPRRFSALKANDNPFKSDNSHIKKNNKKTDDLVKNNTFKTPSKRAQSKPSDSTIFIKSSNNKAKEVSQEFNLEAEVFPELKSNITNKDPTQQSIKLNFGKTLSVLPVYEDKLKTLTTVRSGINIYSTKKSELSCKITKLIIDRMDEQDRKSHYFFWYNNWQKDRNERMSNGEAFYEPYDLDDLDDDYDSGSNEYEMEETEHWNVGKGKAKSYEN